MKCLGLFAAEGPFNILYLSLRLLLAGLGVDQAEGAEEGRPALQAAAAAVEEGEEA